MDGKIIMNFISETNQISTKLFSGLQDDSYAVPDIKWITEEFTPRFKKFLFDNNLRESEENSNDCEDFSDNAISVGRTLYFNDSQKIKEHALSIGFFDYLSNIESHRIVMIVAHENKNLKLVFYEPLTQEIIPLDLKNIGFIWEWRL